MSLPSFQSFVLSWWYSPNTKLALKFETPGATATTNDLDYTNGLYSSDDETYSSNNIITEHPVENLTNISDYVIIQPKTITITGILSSMSTFVVAGAEIPSVLDFSKLARATQILQEMADSKKTLTVTTGLLLGEGIYSLKNAVIQSLNMFRNSTYGRTNIQFNVVFKQVIITDTDATSRAQVNSKSTSGQLDSTAAGIT